VQRADLLEDVDGQPPGGRPAAAEHHQGQALHHVQHAQQRGALQGQRMAAARALRERERERL